MAQDLTLADGPAPGPQSLAWLARNPSRWTIEAANELIASGGPNALPSAIAKFEADLTPVPSDPNAMDDRLRRLAVKVAPSMSPEQGKEWRAVMVDALSDLPAMVALTAAKRGLHRPMTFMNEIEAVVREIAAEVARERHDALWRLRRLEAEIAAAAQPKLAAPEGWEGGQVAPLSVEEIRRTPKCVLSFGISAGYITADEIAAAGVSVDDELSVEAA
jgi:hypothetical protein